MYRFHNSSVMNVGRTDEIWRGRLWKPGYGADEHTNTSSLIVFIYNRSRVDLQRTSRLKWKIQKGPTWCRADAPKEHLWWRSAWIIEWGKWPAMGNRLPLSNILVYKWWSVCISMFSHSRSLHNVHQSWNLVSSPSLWTRRFTDIVVGVVVVGFIQCDIYLYNPMWHVRLFLHFDFAAASFFWTQYAHSIGSIWFLSHLKTTVCSFRVSFVYWRD